MFLGNLKPLHRVL